MLRKTLAPLLVTVLIVYLAQQLLTPFSGELTAPELGLVITVASIAATIASPLWGLALDAIGLRRVLVIGLSCCTAGLAGFALAVTFGLDETLAPGPAFTMMLACRSVVFGAGLAAVPVAALAAAGSVPAADRTRAVGFIGAVQGLSAMIGPVAGGALAGVSLLLPLYVAPVLALALVLWVLVAVKPERPQPAPGRPRELWPIFGAGLLLHLSLALVQAIVVSLVASRLELTAQGIGVVLSVAAIGLMLTQGVLVSILRWPASRLLRFGAPTALAGYAALAVAPSLWLITAAFLVASVGLGLGLTGFAAAATLRVGPQHHGTVAGLVYATAGLTVVIGQPLSTLLYQLDPIVPVIAAGAAAALAVLPAWLGIDSASPPPGETEIPTPIISKGSDI